MPWIETNKIRSSSAGVFHDKTLLSHTDSYHVYNGLDCLLTFEIFDAISPQLSRRPDAQLTYNFERGMQAPALDMMRRGFKIDAYERRVGIDNLEKLKLRLETILNRYGKAIWGKPLNANSPKQLKECLYGAMGIPPVELSFKGTRRVTTNREALERIQDYFHALPVVLCILAIRDVGKRLSVLKSEIDDDSRMRTSYNVAGTATGRWSSSSNVFGGGTNLQNITPELRRMFVADDGKKLCYLDLEQAESWVTGLLVWATVGDDSYLRAIQSGDLHTFVARMVWPALKAKEDLYDFSTGALTCRAGTTWTDGNSKINKALAEQTFYRHFSYRDMSKRGGHASNYLIKPPTMHRHLHIPIPICRAFQETYYGKFVGLPRWHQWTATTIQTFHSLTTPLDTVRHFFGRPGDDATLREAVAHSPQSTVGQVLNLILWRMWKAGFQNLAQIHDAVVFQYPESADESSIIRSALSLTSVPISMPGLWINEHSNPTLPPSNLGQTKTIIIPAECKVGWNWADEEIKTSRGKIKNPDGLRKWKPGKRDERRRLTGLDRIIS